MTYYKAWYNYICISIKPDSDFLKVLVEGSTHSTCLTSFMVFKFDFLWESDDKSDSHKKSNLKI